MKKVFFIAILTSILLLSFLTLAYGDFTAVNLSASDQGVAFSLMQQTASNFFSIRVNDIDRYHPQSSFTEVFPLLYLSADSHTATNIIWQKRQGRCWGRAAREIGLPPNYHGRYMSRNHRGRFHSVEIVDDDSFREMMVMRFFQEYYGADPEILFYWHSRGLSYEDMFIGVNLAYRIHRHPQEFFELRMAGRDWRFIAFRYRFPYEELRQPAPPLRRVTVITEQYPDQSNYDDHHSNYRHDHHHRW